MNTDEYALLNLEEKSVAEINSLIGGAKRKMGLLRNEMEHADWELVKICYQQKMEELDTLREFIARAKQYLLDSGNEVPHSAADKKAEDFDKAIRFLKEIKIVVEREGEERLEKTMEPDKFLRKELRQLHVSEWKNSYTPAQGDKRKEGLYWKLKFSFGNKYKTIVKEGRNNFPYNFTDFLELFEIKLWKEEHPAKYESLTKYIPEMEDRQFGEWIIDQIRSGTLDSPIRIPLVSDSKFSRRFIRDLFAFAEEHKEFRMNEYEKVLEENGLSCKLEVLEGTETDFLDGTCVLAMLMEAARADRFGEGPFLRMFQNGCILHWLQRLKKLDDIESEQDM